MASLSSLISDVLIDSISVGERLRPVTQEAVDRMAEDIRRRGQLQPIIVTRRDGSPKLVAGHHRLLAMKKLGYTSISAVVLPAKLDPDDWLLVEISENLIRRGLNKDQRDEHIRQLAAVLERKGEDVPPWVAAILQAGDLQSGQNVPIETKREDGRGHRPQGTASKIADLVGVSAKTVRRALNPEKPSSKTSQEPKPPAPLYKKADTGTSKPDVDPFASWIGLTEGTATLTAKAIFEACPVRSRPTLSQRCEAIRAIIDELDDMIERPDSRGAAA